MRQTCDPTVLDYGVSQGPVLSHILFLYYNFCIFIVVFCTVKKDKGLPLTNCDVHDNATRHRVDLCMPRKRLSKYLNCFPVSDIRCFNALIDIIILRNLPVSSLIPILHPWLLANPLYYTEEYLT